MISAANKCPCNLLCLSTCLNICCARNLIYVSLGRFRFLQSLSLVNTFSNLLTPSLLRGKGIPIKAPIISVFFFPVLLHKCILLSQLKSSWCLTFIEEEILSWITTGKKFPAFSCRRKSCKNYYFLDCLPG